MMAPSNTELAKEYTFKTKGFDYFVLREALRWLEVIEDWIVFGREVHFIFYEKFVEDPIQETRNLVKYLKLPVDEGRLSCLSKENTGSFFRTEHQAKVNLTLDHHRTLRMVIQKADSILKDHINKGLPIEKYQELKDNLC